MSKTVCPMVARSDWGVGSIQQKGLSHTSSKNQSSVGFHGPKTAGWIVFLNGAHRGEDLRLPIGETKVGSSWNCDLVLTGLGIGSTHAYIRLGGDDGSIIPAAANREIKINNQLISGPQQLVDGDLITLGDLHGIFRTAAQHSSGYKCKEYAKPVTMPLQTLPKLSTYGWLVVLRGPLMGQDFRLVNGLNRIGSQESLEVCIPDPHLIGNCFSVICSPAKGCQVVFVAEGRALTVNGTIAEKDRIIRDSDVISIDRLELLLKWF